ncbi:MAG: hypothetical protein V4792_15360 [Pseudomonadota bacterium]
MPSSHDQPLPSGNAAVERDAAARCVLLLNIEPATATLFDEWLAHDGLRVQREACTGEALALILIELPFPRQDGAQQLQRLAAAWPGVPVVALSPTFLPGVSPHGEVARQLGAAAVLAAPVSRVTLCAAVASLLGGTA